MVNTTTLFISNTIVFFILSIWCFSHDTRDAGLSYLVISSVFMIGTIILSKIEDKNE